MLKTVSSIVRSKRVKFISYSVVDRTSQRLLAVNRGVVAASWPEAHIIVSDHRPPALSRITSSSPHRQASGAIEWLEKFYDEDKDHIRSTSGGAENLLYQCLRNHLQQLTRQHQSLGLLYTSGIHFVRHFESLANQRLQSSPPASAVGE